MRLRSVALDDRSSACDASAGLLFGRCCTANNDTAMGWGRGLRSKKTARKGGAMLAAFGVEALGVVVGDMVFVDPSPNEGQETPERGVRLELRLVDRAAPQGSIYAGIPLSFSGPVRRGVLSGSTASPPGTLARAHHHPRFNGWEPGRRHFVPELSADPLTWLAGELADPDAVLARAGVDAGEVSEADKTGLAAAAPEIIAAVKRLLDGV